MRFEKLTSPQLVETFHKFHETPVFIVRSKGFDCSTLQGTQIQFTLSHLNFTIDNHYIYIYIIM